ncbi:tRNA 4-thiouridine(8) synthase ThiI [Patescibacteria group bacterium]|nr:tRNA 4-thiouridine(8) synthase ThiI [Patescibacteria group bacterium]
MKNIIIIHYAEIALKGENRRNFEKKLVENIKLGLKNLSCEKISRISGRILIYPKDNAEIKKFKTALNYVFGISHFSFGWEISADLEEIKITLAEMLKKRIAGDSSISLCGDYFEQCRNAQDGNFIKKKIVTFRITARRAEKNFPKTSEEINREIGEYVLEKLKVKSEKLKVKLKNPDINCFIEIVEGKALIYFEKIKGLGGLPVGTSGKVLSLISSGFDSPVAAWRLMKRGARVDFIHFHSYPRTGKASINNVKNLIKILNKYQFNSTLYLAPLLDIQREIFSKCEERLRIILYRRFMFRIAEALAWKIGAGALVTGESLGQVASQTLENIGVANNAVSIPIFRPFIGADKIEIIDEAKKIGTYEFSSQPYEDCCSLFTPRHPATKARLGQVEFEESKLDSEKLIKEAIEKTEKVEIKN